MKNILTTAVLIVLVNFLSFDSFASNDQKDNFAKNEGEVIKLESIKSIKEWNIPQRCVIPPLRKLMPIPPPFIMNLGIGVSDTYFSNDIMRWNLGRN